MKYNLKYLKSFIKNNSSLEDFSSTLGYYRHNLHTIPGIQELLCKMGRHDYEGIDYDAKHNNILLECFYCQKMKSSHLG